MTGQNISFTLQELDEIVDAEKKYGREDSETYVLGASTGEAREDASVTLS
jgi:hypothetical protein